MIREIQGTGDAKPIRRGPVGPTAQPSAPPRPAADRLDLGASAPRAPESRATESSAAASPAQKPQGGFLARLWDGTRSLVRGAGTFVQNLFDHREIWRNASLPAERKNPGKLTVASYNILLGGQRIEQAEAALRKLDADVVCLQEASLESSMRLARNLGYHLAFATTPLKTAGKAILSRYPIEKVEDRAFESVPFTRRLAAYYQESIATRKFKETEPLAKRSILHAQIRVGDRVVDVLDTHLSLKHAPSNAAELQELADYAARLSDAGHTVVAAGDFNTNFALAGDNKADAAGTIETPTDTMAEFRARYPCSVRGNVATPEGKAGVDRLATELRSFWTEAANREVVVGGLPTTADAALGELKSGKVKAGSARYEQLQRAADGITHFGAGKRFDNVFVSRDARVERAVIDQTAQGSDHQPVLAEFAW